MRTKLIWSGLGLIAVVWVGQLVFQGTGWRNRYPPYFDRHIEDGLNPGPYPSNPPAGGRHYASTIDAGFYTENSPQAQGAFPEGNLVYNLEHGYGIFWYNCAELNEGDCTTLKSDIQSVMNDFKSNKLIAFPWPSLDILVAMTS